MAHIDKIIPHSDSKPHSDSVTAHSDTPPIHTDSRSHTDVPPSHIDTPPVNGHTDRVGPGGHTDIKPK
jgi:hypothetical protein